MLYSIHQITKSVLLRLNFIGANMNDTDFYLYELLLQTQT